MGSRFSRRRRERDEPSSDDDLEPVHLDDDGHAWWAQRELQDVWAPPADAPEPEAPPERDILAEHFGPDWRTSFGFEPRAPEPEAQGEDPAPPMDTSDPYAVLELDASASWDEIVDAHRRLARRHHPDVLASRPEAERVAGEERIRAINAAYAELRVRRGR